MIRTHMVVQFIVFITIFLGLDYYVLRTWSRYVRKRNWRKVWQVAHWYMAPVMLGLLMYASWHRWETGFLVQPDAILLGVATFWYLPKVLFALIFFVRDLKKFFVWGYNRMFPHKEPKTLKIKLDQPNPRLVEGRRKFIQTAGLTAAAAPFVITGDALLRKTYDFTTYNVDLVLPDLPRALDGLRIAQLSDLHAGSFASDQPMQEVRRIVQGLKPDLIFITGDYVNFHPKELKTIYAELERLNAPLGVIGSLGNHDHYNTPEEHEILKKALRQSGIHLLVNQNLTLDIDGAKLQIAGTDNDGLGQRFADLPLALQGLKPENPTILLAHDPTFWNREVSGKAPVDITLSGHTHGGQVGMSILGKEISVAQFVYKQWAGLYRENEQLLYVNRGIGTVGPLLRIGIPPEISHFTLRRAEHLASNKRSRFQRINDRIRERMTA